MTGAARSFLLFVGTYLAAAFSLSAVLLFGIHVGVLVGVFRFSSQPTFMQTFQAWVFVASVCFAGLLLWNFGSDRWRDN